MKSAAWSALSFILFVTTYFFSLNVYQFSRLCQTMEGDNVALTLFGFWKVKDQIPAAEAAGYLQILTVVALVLWVLTLICGICYFKKKKEENKAQANALHL